MNSIVSKQDDIVDKLVAVLKKASNIGCYCKKNTDEQCGNTKTFTSADFQVNLRSFVNVN